MPITIDCPRCRTALSIPSKLAGQYAFCPKCQGRVWVPREEAVGISAAGSAAGGGDIDPMAPVQPFTGPPPVPAMSHRPAAAARAGTTAVPPPEPLPASPPVPMLAPSVASPSVSGSPAAPPAVESRSTRRVATFITADVAESQLTLAADGKLPELHLTSENASEKKGQRLGGNNQWLMMVLICGSLLASSALLLLDNKPATKVGSERQNWRGQIEDKYFGTEGHELKPYQLKLREAAQAHARNDFKAERKSYEEVLGLLRDENLHPLGRSLTGRIESADDSSIPCDKNLEELISILLQSM